MARVQSHRQEMKSILLGNTGLRVSSLALGTARLGKSPSGVDDAEARRALVRFAEAGGTLIDSSNAYQDGHAEVLLGDFLRDVGRDAFVICTKYARPTDATSPARRVGSHRGAMRDEVESSLRRLRTERIDLYLVHFDDGITPMEEILRGFDDLSRAGKIVHAGLSNFPAWRVATGAAIADARGSTPLVALQMQYHLGERSIEREHLALAKARGMTLMAWSPLGGGTVLQHVGLVSVAATRGCDPATVAIAWLQSKGVLPVLGARTAAHLDATLAELSLTPEELTLLDGTFDRGYPYTLLDEVRASHGLPLRDVL
jgi:aryl-alcohol dehydrogenase-like predicted oxidoreductase